MRRAADTYGAAALPRSGAVTAEASGGAPVHTRLPIRWSATVALLRRYRPLERRLRPGPLQPARRQNSSRYTRLTLRPGLATKLLTRLAASK